MLIGNEFAEVVVSFVEGTNGPRLLLSDRATGRSRFVDPLVLEALVFMSDLEMEHLADPALVVEGEGGP